MNISVPHDGKAHTMDKNSNEFDRALLNAIQEASPDGILVVDGQGVVVSYNQRFVETWKLDTEHLDANSGTDGSIPEDRIMYAAIALLKDPDAFIQRVMELYAHPEERDYCEIELKDGRTLERHSVGLHNDHAHYLGRVWFFRDITERKRGEAALRELALHDPLTGELNRGHFLERAKEEHERSRRYQSPLGILMLDLDNFKEINDQYGHAAGDAVLQTVCERWRAVLRNVDLLGRIGGEEFAILLPDSDWEATQIVAERLRATVADDPIYSVSDKICCTVSGGITMIGAADRNIQDALRRADEALYRAKHKGRNQMEALEYQISEYTHCATIEMRNQLKLIMRLANVNNKPTHPPQHQTMLQIDYPRLAIYTIFTGGAYLERRLCRNPTTSPKY